MSTVAGPPASRLDQPVRQGSRTAPGPRPTRVRRRFIGRRLALAGGLLALLLAAVVALVLALSGSGEAPPATGAAAIVPADALAYVSLSTDPGRPAVTRAREIAGHFPDWPLLQTVVLNRLRAIVGGSSSADYATGISPWLGKEAAVALLSSPTGAAQPLVVLEVARRARAQAFLRGAGATSAGSYDGAGLLTYASGTELAFVGHYLLAGPDAGVRGALDVAHRRATALAHNAAYERAMAGAPDDRVLSAYLPAVGIHRLLAARTGVAGAIGQMLERPGLQGTAVSVSAGSAGARVLIHSVLGVRTAGSRSFTPTLQSVLPAGSTLMLDVPGLDRAAPSLLHATATAGIAGNIGPLLERVGAALTAQGVDVRKFVSLFDGESAVAIAPGPTPALLIVARVHNQAAARTELAALEGPVTSLFSPSGSAGGQEPELADRAAGGTTIHELQIGPGLQLDYAVFNGLVVISTSVHAIDAVAQRSRSLAQETTYQAALSEQPTELTSLVFGDVPQLMSLAEQTGLTGGTQTRQLLPDFLKVRAIGLSSTSGRRDTTTELSLDIP